MGRDPKKVLGDINEFRAIIKFLNEGYMVFKNVSGTGPIDLVLVHQETGEIRKIDVKTITYRKSWAPNTKIARQRSKEQVRLGVEFEFMDREDD
jgi:hypothetical protein|tara:strand:- start:31 stop:312 length:282 start_codon:yes stop_codon:yes gene_type:complete